MLQKYRDIKYLLLNYYDPPGKIWLLIRVMPNRRYITHLSFSTHSLPMYKENILS